MLARSLHHQQGWYTDEVQRRDWKPPVVAFAGQGVDHPCQEWSACAPSTHLVSAKDPATFVRYEGLRSLALLTSPVGMGPAKPGPRLA